MMGGAVSLCRVFQNWQAVPFGNGHDRIHVHGATVQMNDRDGPGAGCDGRSQRIRIQTGVIRSRLHRHRCGSRVAHGQPGGNVGVTGHDHFIARADSPAPQRQLQGIQPVAHRDAVLHAAVRRKGCLEGCGLFAQQHPAAVHHPFEGFSEGQAMTLVDGLQVQEGDGGCSIHGRTGRDERVGTRKPGCVSRGSCRRNRAESGDVQDKFVIKRSGTCRSGWCRRQDGCFHVSDRLSRIASWSGRCRG